MKERIYIAARFSRRPEANALANELKALGYSITSRWVLPDCTHVLPTGLSAQAADAERRRFADEDIQDVFAADWLVSLQEEPRTNGRGGRHVEFGMALALGHRVSAIGPRETVFHHGADVEHFETVEAFLDSLKAAAKEGVR
jgi:nucleoside 2-deoxyribosyltransferase